MGINGRIVHFYWKSAWKYKLLTTALLSTVTLALLVFQFLPPLVVAAVLDKINHRAYNPGDLWGSFGSELLLYAALIFIGGSILWRIAIVLIWQLEMRVLQDISQRVFNHLMLQSAHFHANRFGGSLVSQTNKLVSSYVRMADTTVFNLGGLLLSFVFTIVILAPRAPWVALGLVVFSVFFLLVAIKITEYVRTLNARESVASTKQTGALADAVTNIMAVKGFAGGLHEKQRFAVATDKTRAATYDVMSASVKRDTFFSLTTGALGIGALLAGTTGVVVFGADVGTMFLIVTYSGIISQRLWDFSQNALRSYNRALGEAKDMVEILDIKPDVQDPASPEKLAISNGAIALDSMSFTHADAKADDALFSGLSLHIKAGEKVGLVGHSGSGKTTLVRLLLRFSDVDGGRITIDGQDISHITQDDLHRSIAYVPQEPLLFHRSIFENISYGKPDATKAEVEAASIKAHAHEFVEKLPHGYDTLVGERGVKLSGGQRQRIAIARAILKEAPILVLDEATSALDSESERLIQSSLRDLMAKRTSIVIAHRLSTIQKMDRILVLENGEIIEDGSHKELVAANGIYASLWKHQSGGFIEE